jgi:membrane fusion protein (multidrug efflux system)
MTPALRKRFIIVSLILLIIFGGLFTYHLVMNMLMHRFIKNFTPPPVSVNVITVQPGPWQDSYDTVGNLVAIEGTDISPQVSGTVTRVLFNSGDYVNVGQPLIIMDTGILAAQLEQAIANERLQKINYVRAAILYRQGVISQSDFDTTRANYQEALGSMEQNQQELNQKILAAPFSGRVGIRQVSVGQYLNAGDQVTNIQQLDPIYANVEVPEQFLGKLHQGQPVEFIIDTFPNQVFKGKITAFDARVGNNTKAITVQATIPNGNPKMRLLPGMMAKVRVLMAQQNNLISVPQQAVSYTLYGNSIYVVSKAEDPKTHETSLTAKAVNITTGEQNGNQVLVTSGLHAGDQIVVDGQVKLQDGSRIKIANGTAAS